MINQLLGVPAEKRIWVVVTLGYVDEEARKTRPGRPAAGRKPVEDFVHWDSY